MTEPTVRIFDDPQDLARAAAEELVRLSREALAARDLFSVGLAGGSTPRALYTLLADPREPYFERVDWPKVVCLVVDERPVPPDHPESNYRMARETLLSKVPVRPGNVVRFHTEGADPAFAAAQYEALLRRALHLRPGAMPRLDLVLLGMGADGHTASWFPGSEVLEEHERLAVAVPVAQLGTLRYTLTPIVVEHAAHVLFLVTGREKAPALREVLAGDERPDPLPARRALPRDGTVVWLVDREAAALL